jgi:hypothetical protein
MTIFTRINVCFSQSTIFEKFLYNPEKFVDALELPGNAGYLIAYDNLFLLRMDRDGNIQQGWETDYPHVIRKIINSADNHIVLLGLYGFLCKLDTNCNVLWSRNYDLGYGLSVAARNIYLTPDEGFFVIGSCSSPSGPFAMKLDKDGNAQWAKVYSRNVQYSTPQVFQSAIIDGQGNYYILDDYSPRGCLNKLDNSGNLLWTRQYGTYYWSDFYSFIKDAEQDYFYLSSTYPNNAIIKVDTSGAVISHKQYNNRFLESSFFYHDSRLSLIAQGWRGITLYSFDSAGTPVMAKSLAWNSNPLDTVNFINKDVFINTTDNGLMILGNYAEWHGYPQGYQKTALLIKLDNTLNSACHIFPDELDTVSSIAYISDTLIYHQINRNVSITSYPLTFSPQKLSDTVLCPENSINEIKISRGKLLIYPNPASDKITITAGQRFDLEIFTVEGQMIRSIKAIEAEETIDLKEFSAGVYIIRARTSEVILVKKFIKF